MKQFIKSILIIAVMISMSLNFFAQEGHSAITKKEIIVPDPAPRLPKRLSGPFYPRFRGRPKGHYTCIGGDGKSGRPAGTPI